MFECADLEIRIERIGSDTFITRMQLQLPGSEVEIDLKLIEAVKLMIDLEAFSGASTDLAYGRVLGELLFGNGGVRTLFEQARSAADSLNTPFRLRLAIASSAQDLHLLNWERLVYPGDSSPLFAEPRILFSRFIASSSFRPVYLRRRDDLRALVVVSSPKDIGDYGVTPLDAVAELEAVRGELHPVPVETLKQGERATLKSIAAKLSERFDVLHLVCHGATGPSGPRLLLENENGTAELVAGDELARELRNLEHPPRLVVMASCQSAGQQRVGSSGVDVLSAIGPQLAAEGIPAVIAMGGEVSIQTANRFTKAFFSELSRDGVIDQSVAVARDTVRQAGAVDWWMPILFMRLKSGQIGWYQPGFGREDQQQIRWKALISSLDANRCTPILGLGLQETLVGPRRRIARRWAEDLAFPVAPRDRDNFTQIAQFLRIKNGAPDVQIALEKEFRTELMAKFGSQLAAAGATPKTGIWKLLATAGNLQRERVPDEPHTAIAVSSVDVYITADPSTLLTDALTAQGKKPRTEYSRWREDLVTLPLLRDNEPEYIPSPEEPLVYHLFGIADEPASLVLTEDDYFDFLIGITKYRELVPPKVLRSLTHKNLLFVGFHLEDWAFRTTYRVILSLGGTHLLLQNVNVAAQVDLEAERVASQQPAREFLESAFVEANLNVFWGELGDFITELNRRRGPASALEAA